MPGTLVWEGPDLDILRAEIRAVQSARDFKPVHGRAGPGIMLVGDHGVYFMGNYVGRTGADGSRAAVAYARGCNPEKDPDFYENKERIFGADDGVDFFPVADVVEILDPKIVGVTVKVSASKLTLFLKRARLAS